MTIFQQPCKNLFALALIILLTACGGGGSGGDSKDATPSNFSFTSVSSAAVSTEVTSAPITVAGMDKEAAISITGGTYSINDAAFTAAAGMVSSGQTVKVKVISAATTNTPSVATLTIGGVVGTFTVTTLADVTPNAFSFTAKTDAVLSSENISDTVTLSGFDIPVSISIVGGEYSISGGTYTSAPGTVSAGQTLTVKTTASASVSTAVNAVVTVGGVAGTYTVTSIPDTTAPSAQILFPTPVSMSNGATLKVRGTASDAHSTITSVTVGGIAAVSSDNYATWTADVPLTLSTTNTINVATTDSAGNTQNAAASVSVKQVASLVGQTIPDALNPITSVLDLAFDGENNRVLVADSIIDGIVAVNLTTGARTILSNSSVPDTVNPIDYPVALALDSARNRILVADENDKKIVAVDLASGARTLLTDTCPVDHMNGIAIDVNNNRALVGDFGVEKIFALNLLTNMCTVFSDSTIPNASTPFLNPGNIVFDYARNRALITDAALYGIVAVNLDTGARSILSDNTTQTTLPFVSPNGIAIDVVSNRVAVTDNDAGSIFWVDLITGVRTVLSSATLPNSNNPFRSSTLTHDSSHKILFAMDQTLNAVYAVDMVTGERVVISK